MTASILTGSTLFEAAEALESGATTSEGLTLATLERIEALDHLIRSYVAVDASGALAAATAADARRAAGRVLGPLDGIPIAIKDLFDVCDLPTRANSRTTDGTPRTHDATVVRRLRASGAIIIGKLQMNEFAMGGVSEDDYRPPVRNPWDLTRTTGGSIPALLAH